MLLCEGPREDLVQLATSLDSVLVDSIACGHDHKVEVGQATEIRSRLEAQVVAMREPYFLMIAGKFKAGKSTFVNAVLDADFELPTAITAATALLTIVRYGPEKRAVIERRDGKSEIMPVAKALRLVDAARNENKNLGREIDRVSIELPRIELQHVHLVDSPGLGSAFEEHDRVTTPFLQRADAILWMADAERPGDEEDLEAIRALSEYRKRTILVVNKIDVLWDDADEMDRTIKLFQDEYSQYCTEMVRVSAASALQARRERDEALYDRSGFPELMDLLRTQFFTNETAIRRTKWKACLDGLEGIAALTGQVLEANREEYQRQLDASKDEGGREQQALGEVGKSALRVVGGCEEKVEAELKHLGAQLKNAIDDFITDHYAFESAWKALIHLGREEKLRAEAQKVFEERYFTREDIESFKRRLAQSLERYLQAEWERQTSLVFDRLPFPNLRADDVIKVAFQEILQGRLLIYGAVGAVLVMIQFVPVIGQILDILLGIFVVAFGSTKRKAEDPVKAAKRRAHTRVDSFVDSARWQLNEAIAQANEQIADQLRLEIRGRLNVQRSAGEQFQRAAQGEAYRAQLVDGIRTSIETARRGL